MYVVEGKWSGKSLAGKHGFLSGTVYDIDNVRVNLKNELISVELIAEDRKTTSGGGVQGAAAGAVLGFLVAGPIGTMVGGGLGSKSKTQGSNKITAMLAFASGDVWVIELFSSGASELGKLKQIAATYKAKVPLSNKVIKKVSTKKVDKPEPAGIKALNKPKKPDTLDFMLKKIKGRKFSAKSKLPNYDFLSKWNNVEGADPATLILFKRKFKQEIENYNNFLWVYFDINLETEDEFDSIVERVIRNLIAQSNTLKEMEANIVKFNSDRTGLDVNLERKKIKVLDYNKELEGKGFFEAKTPLKTKIWDSNLDIENIKKQISANKRKITTNTNKLKSGDYRELIGIKNNIDQFELIFNKLFPKLKKPKPGLKKINLIDRQFFLDIYGKHFDSIWDKKIKDDKEKRKTLKDKQAKEKEEEKIRKENQDKNKIQEKLKEKKQASSTKSIKERLDELKYLLNEGLITDDEFDIKRTKILDDI